MIFGSPLYGKVLRGEKTQTRRLVKPSDLQTKYQVGMRRAVQKGRGQPGEGHIILTGVRTELVGYITFEDARAEGFKTTDDFKRYWVALHDPKWIEGFEENEDEKLDVETVGRFELRHAHKQVWVLTFQLDRAEYPRFLADRNVRADYVDSPARALSHEPEAVDASTQGRFSREGHQGWVAREKTRELDRELLEAEERLRLVRIDARAQGVDIGHLEAQIMGRVRAAERKVHNKNAA